MKNLQYISSILLLTIQQIFASEIHYCNSTISCPEKYPCCSQDGTCGTGNYCLGDCDVRFSFSLDSCMPAPICQDLNTKFNKYSSQLANGNTFLGNVSEADWTYTGYVMDYEDEESLVMAMPKNSGGTVVSSTRDVWYGKVSATLKTSHLAGVITSFILYSGVKDEIDFEWVGSDLGTTQTNFYWNGVLNWNNSANISTTDTFNDYHTYELDWQEDYINWSVDGVVGRTLYKNQTYNSTSGRYEFPQTPSKVHISIWPGGNATNPPGTVAWAGGEINWDSDDIKDTGYYYALLKEVNITCGDIPSGTKQNGTESYIYTNENEFLVQDVAISNKRVYMDTYDGSGDDPDAGATTSTTKKSSSSHKKTSTSKSHSKSISKTTDSSSDIKSTTSIHSSSSITTTHYEQVSQRVSTKIEVQYVTSALPKNQTSSMDSETDYDNTGHIHSSSKITLVISLILSFIL